MPVQLGVTDCHRIIYESRRFTSQDYEPVHRHCLSWLKSALDSSAAQKKVVVLGLC
jgi:hypothetical protein